MLSADHFVVVAILLISAFSFCSEIMTFYENDSVTYDLISLQVVSFVNSVDTFDSHLCKNTEGFV